VEVKAFTVFLDRNDFLVSVGLQDQLLKVAEGPSVRHFLADLDDSVPSMRSEGFLAILTLLVDNRKLDHHRLLEHTLACNLLLHRQLNPDSSGVLLGPDEGRVNEPNFFPDAPDLLQAQT
jgi:hypothetical protein